MEFARIRTSRNAYKPLIYNNLQPTKPRNRAQSPPHICPTIVPFLLPFLYFLVAMPHARFFSHFTHPFIFVLICKSFCFMLKTVSSVKFVDKTLFGLAPLHEEPKSENTGIPSLVYGIVCIRTHARRDWLKEPAGKYR
jgi:hypothetical protein